MPVLQRLLIVWFMALCCLPARAQTGEDASGAVVQALNQTERLPLPIQRVRAALYQYYIAKKAPLYWQSVSRRQAFIQRLNNAGLDGLNPNDYAASTLADMSGATETADPQAAARTELYFSAFYIAYASDLRTGRLAPQRVDPHLYRKRKTIDPVTVLADLAKQSDPAKALNAYEPRNPHYLALKKMMRVYATVAQENRWPTIPVGGNINPGASDGRIPAIRSLLSFTGDLDGKVTKSTQYDAALVEAVRLFQNRHGLEAKGVIGKQTVLAMNVTPEERIRQIMVNMERWRWMPDQLGDDHFMVNIAAYQLQHVEQGQIIDHMDVVAGAVATQTPEFSDEMEYIEFNPYWTVPYSIATKEMLPRLRGNPMAYAAEFDIFANGQLTAWGGVNWTAYGPGNFPFTFRQKPGPQNALGRVKFMFPNPYNIYFHDTPAKEKFSATTRAFSHGCIRLARPMDLAHALVDHVPGWSPSLVDAVVASGRNTVVKLPSRIPVHIIYSTAFKGQYGIEFRPDIYGRDRKLEAALLGRSSS